MKKVTYVGAVLVWFLTSCSAFSTLDERDEPELSNGEMVADETLVCAQTRYSGEIGEITVLTNTGYQAAPYASWAQAIGCFEEFGLEVTVQQGGPPTDRIAALTGGSVDAIWLTFEPVLTSVSNAGIDLTLVSPHYGYTTELLDQARRAKVFEGTILVEDVLVGAPGLTFASALDLQGKVIGRQSAAVSYGIDVIVLEAGGDPSTIDWLDLGLAERLEALQRGDLEASALSGPWAYEALAQGGQFISYYAAHDYLPGPNTYWVTSADKAIEKAKELKRFREAMWATYTLLQSNEKVSQFRDFVAEEYGLERSVLESLALPSFYPRAATPEDLQGQLDKMYARGDLDSKPKLEETTLFSLE